MSGTVKVGVFAVLALVVLGYLIFKFEDVRLFRDSGRRVDATFDSVAGLDDKATVRVAGVRVGRVDGIRLSGSTAVVSLLLDTPVELTDGAYAEISSLGLLGDKFVKLHAGTPGAPLLADDVALPGRTPIAFDDAMAQISSIGTSLQDAIAGFDPKASGELVNRLLTNLEATSATIQALVEGNREQFSSTVGNFETFSQTLAAELPKLTAQVERVLQQVEAVVADNRGSLNDSMEHIAEVTSSMRTSMDNLNQITGQIASGEGTIGKFVSSPEAHDKLTSTLTAVESGVATLTDTLGRVQRLKLDLDFNGFVLQDTDDTHSAFSLSLTPGESNRFYRIGAVDDSRGVLRIRSETETITSDDGATMTTTTDTRVREDKITLAAQFGFRFGLADLRAGLFESTAGAALDFRLVEDRVWLTLEAFEFGREDDLDPHLRLTGKWQLNPNIYLLGGYDDPLVSERDSLFIGGGVRWTDDDFKYLLGSLPTGN